MDNKGFTLVEMLVVMAIFLSLMLIVSDIFLSVSLSQQRTLSERRAMNGLQTAMERIARQIRAGQVDLYAVEQAGMPDNEPLAVLPLIDEDGHSVEIYKGEQACSEKTAACVEQKTSGQAAALSPDGVSVERLDFYLWPRNGAAPLITIVLTGRPVSHEETDALILQTSINSH